MKGRVVVLDEVAGRRLAALVVDGRLDDLLIDPPAGAPPGPGAVFRGIVERPMKGQGGMFLRLPGGQTAFLRQTRGLAPGRPLVVQVTGSAEPGKAVPVTTRLVLKGRYAIVTPGAPGLNVARALRDEDERARLGALAAAAMAGRDEDLGLILRSACDGVAGEAIAAEVAELADLAARLLAEAEGRTPEALLDAPDAAHLAWRDWAAPDPDEVIDRPGAFAAEGVWDLVAALRGGPVALPGGGTMWLEATRALVAVDVNTGPDTSPAAALKANLAAARELPRQLRLRGLGGQVVVDFAPMPKPDRVPLEQSLRALTRAEGIETALVGWTGLGLFEMQRKRERLPLEQALAGVWPQ